MIVKVYHRLFGPYGNPKDSVWHMWDRADEVCFSDEVYSVPFFVPTGSPDECEEERQIAIWFNRVSQEITSSAYAPHCADTLPEFFRVHWLFNIEARVQPDEHQSVKDRLTPQRYSFITFIRHSPQKEPSQVSNRVVHAVMFDTEAYLCNDHGDTIRGFRVD